MVRHVGAGPMLLGIAALGLVSVGHAQPGAETQTPADSPKEGEVQAPDPRPGPGPAVLFLLPKIELEARKQLREALLAQFALIEASLVFEPEASPSPSLGERVAQVQKLAAELGAIAAFWIEAQPDGRWFVHMMDSQQERIIVRPVDARGDRRPAAIEAVAVMARESTRALIEGVPEPQAVPAPPTPLAPAPEAKPTPAAQPSAPGADLLRLSAGYSGSDYAQQIEWTNGVGFGASWLGFSPLYGGLSYLWTPPIKLASRGVALEVQRLPFTVYAGYRHKQDRLELDAELGFSLEWLLRSFPQAQPNLPGEQQVTMKQPAGTDGTFTALAPRLRAEFRLLPSLGLYAAGGVDILLNRFKYLLNVSGNDSMNVAGSNSTLLLANPVRAMAEAGIAFYP